MPLAPFYSNQHKPVASDAFGHWTLTDKDELVSMMHVLREANMSHLRFCSS